MYKDMMDTIGMVNAADPELGAAMERELTRQRESIELIASENIVSPAVMAAMGSVLTNKYAEGLPGKRYYGGCVYVDEVENIAIQRACQLFGAKYANVQPHSGAQANLAVYFALLELGDTVMGMDLSQGGHLTHGSPVNMSGKNYHFISYGVGADGVIDYAELEKQVRKVRPKMLVAGASAYPRAIDFEKLAEIAHGYGAYLMVDMAHIAGLVAGGQHQSPVPYADVVTTTTHKTLRGPRGGLILTNNPIIAKRINSAVFPGTQGGPLEHVIAAKAVCFGEALKPEFKEYARKIVENAQALAAALQQRGVKLVSGGTDNHLMLIDLRDEECTGKDLEQRLDSVHITANKNTVPGETRSPFVTSGVRLGTPAVTTRGMGAAEMQVIADCIADCIWHYAEKKDEISERVLRLTREFPLYQQKQRVNNKACAAVLLSIQGCGCLLLQKRESQKRRKTMESLGLLHLYYGDGKGKTTAAMGLALRALGSGQRVVIVQFLKGGQSGEIPLLEQLGATVYRGKAGQKFVFQMNEAEKAATRALQNQNLAAALAQPCDMLVLDEAGSAWELDMVDKALLQQAVLHRPAGQECVLTAHAAPGWMLDAADYLTEMCCRRHPYQKGIAARKGVEY